MTNYQEELIDLRSGKNVPEHSGDYWSIDELAALEELYWNGVSISEIALRLGRNEVDTYQQLAQMGFLSGQCRHREKKQVPTMPCAQCNNPPELWKGVVLCWRSMMTC